VPVPARSHTLRLALILLPFLSGCGEKELAVPNASVRINSPAAKEISGLAASHRSWDLLWVHNDSGNPPVLYAINLAGAPAGALRLKGVKNTDWEDIASFELDGKSLLLVADTGDNAGNKKSYTLLVVEEPGPSELSPAGETAGSVAWKVPFTFSDGSHNCEAAAVDVREGRVFLVTKHPQMPRVYALPLKPPADGSPVVAEYIATLKGIPQPTAAQRIFPTPAGSYRAQVTGMDFSPDLRCAAVLTYGNVLLYRRRPGENWDSAFSRPPQVFAAHGLPQAEAICFSRDGRSLYVTGERTSPLMLRYSVPTEKAE
jgi:hypothetical protein